jgi:eukaryotic-like serine/threonine-protein kinase
MPVRIEPNSEPIAGYRLIERLGVGGFGEVWKCEAPGGLYKAIKIVHGELGEPDAIGDEDSRADQELKALKRVKTVHHPYILSLERFDIIDGQLMIVMELADRTLWDRFKECRSQGLPGIPRQELLGYMRETAEALDLMNDQFQLQHLDIKPQNLFLVFNHVKVADFGLVKDLGTKATATITGGVTPVYAAPETFDGWLSRFSDQYSLAIVYQELLTGQRPFGGATMRQLVLQHLQGNPDLSSLPAADRPVVTRALSKDPEGRYPNCLELVRQLQRVSPSAPADPAANAPVGESEAAGHTQELQTRDVRGNVLGPRSPSNPDVDLDPGRPQVLPPRPGRPYLPVSSDPLPGVEETPPVSIGNPTLPALRRGAESEAPFVPGPIQPALLIGLGGIGLRTLAQLRRRLTLEVARPNELQCIRLLAMDTDPDTLQVAAGTDPAQTLESGELLPTRLHRASHYLKPTSGKSLTDSWLNSKLLYRIPRNHNSAGLRPLGRLAFVDNVRHILRRLEAELDACSAMAAQPPLRPALAPRALTPRVYITACLAGNTGSGMFLDVAFATRDLLRRLGYHSAEIIGLFYLPRGEAGSGAAGLANAYAAMTELNHFSRHPFIARYDTGDKHTPPIVVQADAAPFVRSILFTLPRPTGAGAEAATALVLASAAEYLYRDLTTPLGPAADELRQRHVRDAMPPSVSGSGFHVVGQGRLSWPRQALLEQGSRRICRRLVEGWMTKDARPVAEEMGRWADQTWDGAGLRSEALIGRVHEMCEKIVKQPPERLVTAVTGPLTELLVPKPGKPDAALALGPAVAAVAELDRLLGVPEECRQSNQATPPPGVLENALADATTRATDACEQFLAEQVVRLIEDPRYRLAGAEEALRRLSVVAEQALQAQETLARELNDRAALLYQRVQRELEAPQPPVSTNTNPSGWKLSFGRSTPATRPPNPAAELLELIRQYPKARYHALVLSHINRLYVSLRGQLSDQLREVGFCRARLGELLNMVKPTADTAAIEAVASARVLLPAGCSNLDDALEQLDKDVTRDDLLALDQQIQALIRQHFRALVTVCMGSSAMVRTLAPAMLTRTREFLAPRFGGTSVAELLMLGDGTDKAQSGDHAAAELQSLYQRAAPKSGQTRPDAQFDIAVLPSDARGTELRDVLHDDLPEVSIINTDRPDEIVFCREHIYLTSTGVEHLGTAAQDAYRQRQAADPAAVHTREDIGEWEPAAALVR